MPLGDTSDPRNRPYPAGSATVMPPHRTDPIHFRNLEEGRVDELESAACAVVVQGLWAHSHATSIEGMPDVRCKRRRRRPQERLADHQ
jgi:hypothetical protein